MKKLFLLVCLFLMSLKLASDTQHRYKVAISLSFAEELNKRILSSYLKRELRSLGDVDIVSVNEEWNYIIKITGFETQYKSTGMESGDIVMSWIALKAIDKNILRLPSIWSHGQITYHPESFVIIIDKTDDLDKVAKRIIANFDTTNIEIDRIMDRAIRNRN